MPIDRTLSSENDVTLFENMNAKAFRCAFRHKFELFWTKVSVPDVPDIYDRNTFISVVARLELSSEGACLNSSRSVVF